MRVFKKQGLKIAFSYLLTGEVSNIPKAELLPLQFMVSDFPSSPLLVRIMYTQSRGAITNDQRDAL